MNRADKECECGSPEDCQCDGDASGLVAKAEEELVDQVLLLPVNNKTIVNKCFSDPSSIRVRTSRYQTGSTTRKCVLTLDGYSYVIGNDDALAVLPWRRRRRRKPIRAVIVIKCGNAFSITRMNCGRGVESLKSALSSPPTKLRRLISFV